MHQLTPNDKFMVLASDGVWEFLSNEQVFCFEILCMCTVFDTRFGSLFGSLFTLFCSTFGTIFSVREFLNERVFFPLLRYRECAHYLTHHLALYTLFGVWEFLSYDEVFLRCSLTLHQFLVSPCVAQSAHFFPLFFLIFFSFPPFSPYVHGAESAYLVR